MLLSPRIRLKSLAQLCHRLAVATSAGIDDRKIWSDEAERGTGGQRRVVATIRDQLAARKSITEALPATGNFFPPLFLQMVEVGEKSGRLDNTYRRLASHYDRTYKARREFIGQLSWPLTQLAISLFVIGILIWVMGMMPINRGASSGQGDILGFGLIGTAGLVVYVNILVVIGIAVLLVVEAARRGVGWSRTLQRMVIQIPVIGGALKTLGLSRFTWALQLVLDTPMDLRRALPLALEAAGNDYFARHGRAVADRIERGQTIHASLAETGILPGDLLDAIAVGEESGQLVETMERMSAEYQQRAASAISLLAQLAGYGVWLMISIFIIVMIFQIFSFYIDTLNSVL